ncbi:MAG: VanZ family protein [Eubacterium sp.]|nr:VanZ family protein [Eubacterium sp.]MCC8173831.1 VanZ family protein [Odoribacter sp.]
MEPTEIINKILTDILTALYQPFWFSVLLSILFMFFRLYSHEKIGNSAEKRVHPRGYKQSIKEWIHAFKASSAFRRTFFLTFYTAMILFRTLLNRNMWANPLSDVMGGWWIYDSNGELTTESIENVMLFIPFTVLLMWALSAKEKSRKKVFKRRAVKLPAVLWQSVKITFLFSFTIEFLQLFLRLGTWQLSDVFYNVLGGMIGGLVYWIMQSVKRR